MSYLKQTALEYLISRGLITQEEFDTTRPEQVFKLVKSHKKHQLKELELRALKILTDRQ